MEAFEALAISVGMFAYAAVGLSVMTLACVLAFMWLMEFLGIF